MKIETIPLDEMTPKIEPCEHMTDYISSMSDGSLHGPAQLFTRLHLLTCKKCGVALKEFTSLRTHLGELHDVPMTLTKLQPEVRSALQRAMDDMDALDESPAR